MPLSMRIFWRLLRQLCLSLLLTNSLLPVFAQDHITDRAWFEDRTGHLDWQEVQSLSFQPYSGMLSKGFGNSVIWLKLHIDPRAYPEPAHAEDRLVLRIRPVYLDDIQVYDPLAPTQPAGVIGDSHHPRYDEYQGLDFLLPIERGVHGRDIWLRLNSTSTRQIDVQALNIRDLNRSTTVQSLVFSSYIGMVVVLMVWGFMYWLFSRETIIGAFGLKQLCALLFALCSLGYLRSLWPAAWPAWLLHELTTLFSITAVTGAVWFHVLLLREFGMRPWVQRVHLGLLLLLPLKLSLWLLGAPTWALRLNMIEVLVNPFIFLLSSVLATAWLPGAPKRPTLARPLIVGFYTLLMLMLLLASLPALGLISGSEVGLYIVQVHGLVTAFLVLLLLQYRAHVLGQQQQQVALALERSQLQVRQEREISAEQDKLLAMLAHELKTPLATMHMRLDSNASGSREIRQAIRDMNGVIERCQQTLQLSDRQLSPHPEPLDMVSLVQDAISACAQPQSIELNAPPLLPLHSDRQLCFIVLNNLLENACKYAAPNTPITMCLCTHTDASDTQWMRLEIANQPGTADWPDPTKVFEKYYRSPHARRQAGTGMGLYLVRNLMQVLGGRIGYAPTPEAVCFVLELPLGTTSIP